MEVKYLIKQTVNHYRRHSVNVCCNASPHLGVMNALAADKDEHDLAAN